MTAFTLDEVLAATGGDLAALGGRCTFDGVTTDSRAVAAGQIFVAIRGDTHDGHAFAADAARRGVSCVVVEALPVDLPPSCTAVVVRDALHALGDVAAWHRRRFSAPAVGITGSNGKTTTKELLTAVCEAAYGADAVLRTIGTQNNLVGLPLTILRWRGAERVAVLEMGMNGPAEIWRMAGIAAPAVGVVTCVGTAHLEFLGSVHGIAEAKAELYRRLRPSATAVVNADDPLVAARARAAAGRVLRFGHGGDVDVQAVDVRDGGLAGTSLGIRLGGDTVPVTLRLPGRHNVTNALAAATAAHALGIPAEVIARGLSAARGPAMRMQLVELAGGVTVVNDAYNANPASMLAALGTLAASAGTRRLAVLGDMRELGAEAAKLHRDVGAAAAAAAVDGLYLLGQHAPDMRDGAVAAGLSADRIVVGESHEDLAARLREVVRPGDLLLLKGSRGSAMERVLQHLATERSA